MRTKVTNLTTGKVCLDDIVIGAGQAIEVLSITSSMLTAEKQGLITIHRFGSDYDMAVFLSDKISKDSVAVEVGEAINYE